MNSENNSPTHHNKTILVVACIIGFVGIIGIVKSVKSMFAPLEQAQIENTKSPDGVRKTARRKKPAQHKPWTPDNTGHSRVKKMSEDEMDDRFENMELSENPVEIQAKQIESLRADLEYSQDDLEAQPSEASIAEIQARGAIVW